MDSPGVGRQLALLLSILFNVNHATKLSATRDYYCFRPPSTAETSANFVPLVDKNNRGMESLRKRCFTLNQGYWIYEICPFRKIRQFHNEGNKLQVEYGLGSYQKGQDSEASTQIFVGGTEGRQAEVKFECSTYAKGSVVKVSEPAPMQYQISVSTNAACAVDSVPIVQDKENVTHVQLGSMKLLDPIRGRCFTISKDYWQYEFCPMKYVRQFHMEGKSVSSDMVLGRYDKNLDKMTLSHPRSPKSVSKEGGYDMYSFSQAYTNGTSKRNAEVRAVCAHKNEHSFHSIEEPRVNFYVVIFSTPLACDLNCIRGTKPV